MRHSLGGLALLIAAVGCNNNPLVGMELPDGGGPPSSTGGAGSGAAGAVGTTGAGGTGVPTGSGGTGVSTGSGGTGVSTGSGGTGVSTGSGGTGVSTGSGGTGAPTGAGGSSAADAWIAFDSDEASFNRDIYVIRADGTGRRRLTTNPTVDTQPSFSRDGKKLVFASDRVGSVLQIYLMDLATGATTVVTHGTDGAHDPAFTFDGTRVAYRSGVDVFTAMLDGSDERRVTNGQTCCVGAAFGSPAFTDAQTMFYDDYNAIYSISNGAARWTVVTPTTGEQSHPSLSPDGLHLVLQSTCVGDNAARSLWIVPSTGTTAYSCTDGRRISSTGTDATHPSWGPEDTIVWGSVEGGNNGTNPVPSALLLWQANSLRPLTSGTADDRNPSWSPPGTVIGNW